MILIFFKAREILERIRKRDLISCAGETILTPSMKLRFGSKLSTSNTEQLVKEEILAILSSTESQNAIDFVSEDLYVQVVKIGYGRGDSSPIDSIVFYEPDKSIVNEGSSNKTLNKPLIHIIILVFLCLCF